MVLRRARGGGGGGGGREGDRGCGLRSSVAGLASRAVVLSSLMLGVADAASLDLPDDYRVVHANIVMRHGERSRLVKSTAKEFGDNDGVTLTATGEKQCYDVGTQLRSRYFPLTVDAESTAIEGLTLWYDADRVQVISSGYDRTLESAGALALGLYPSGLNGSDLDAATDLPNNHIIVPIHSSEPANDAVILASDKCPVYDDNWTEFYRTTDFIEKQSEAEAFILEVFGVFKEEGIAADRFPECWEEVVALEQDKLELHAPYNLWDCARVLEAEDMPQTVNFINVATPPPEFTGIELGIDYLEYLVNWVEDHKYEQKITGRMVGGLYITEMNTRMRQVIEHIRSGRSPTAGRFPGIHVTVGHYPTLKGIAGALDIGGLEGIPDYAAHFSFELLFNGSANFRNDEDDFAVRIVYQNSSEEAAIEWLHMSPVFDDENSLGLDESLASARDLETGIMGWAQWEYLMEHQVAGNPTYYENGEQQWCLDCFATVPDTCLKLELKGMTQQWEQALGEVQAAEKAKSAVDDGITGTHISLLSIFGLILGIGMGYCIRPWLDRRTDSKAKTRATVAGDRGLEAWSGTNSANGSFRLGSKKTRHVLGGANGGRGNTAMAVPTTDDLGDSGRMNGVANGVDVEEDGSGSRIPEFAPTSALGEPVPFPHRRQQSNMASGVDSSMMSGIDGDVEMDGTTSPAGDEETGAPPASSSVVVEAPPIIGGASWEAEVLEGEKAEVDNYASTAPVG